MTRTGSRPPVRCGAVLVAATVAIAFAGCGSRASASRASTATAVVRAALPRLTHATLVLDFVPNAVHAGIYRALAAGYYRAENIDLRVIPPPSTSSTLSLITAGRATFGLADGSDVATQIARGRDAEAVMAIAQRPLGGLIALASEKLRSPASLAGRTVGITGVPSDTAVLDTVVASAGGNPGRVHVVNIGFNGAQDLAAGRISAFTGFWPADGVQLAVSGHPITVFKLDRYGGPAYPGLVAFTTRAIAASEPALVRAFVAATVHGYDDVIRQPLLGLHDLLTLNPALDRRFTSASLRAYLPLFDDGGHIQFGRLQPANVAALSRWMVAHKLIARPIAVARYGSNAFLPAGR